MLRLINFVKSLFCKKDKKPVEESKDEYIQPSYLDIDIFELNRNNFRASEFYSSNEAQKEGIDNRPKQQHILFNLMKLADSMQYLHNFLRLQYPSAQVTITITSGYRNPKVNKLVGGSPDSVHMTGLAADFVIRVDKVALPLEDAARYVVESGIVFDQLLVEHKQGIIHLGLASDERKARKEVKTAWIENGNWKTKTLKV